jgi:hypothetical protein
LERVQGQVHTDGHLKAREAEATVLALIERALIEEGEGSLGNAIADEVRKTVNLLDAARKEVVGLQDTARLAQIRRQAAETAQHAAEGAKAAADEALAKAVAQHAAEMAGTDGLVDDLQRKLTKAKRSQSNAVSEVKSKLRAASLQAFDQLAWTMSHPRYRLKNKRGMQVPVKCCPYCQGLSPHQAPSHPEVGHRNGCLLAQAQQSWEQTLSM